MQIKSVLDAFAALAQESRLKVFRLLVKQGPSGLPAGTIAMQLGITPATMSHHLDQLSQAGLVTSRRAGRSIIYRANYDTMQRLIDYLMENCCQGKDCGIEIKSCSSSPGENSEKAAPAEVERSIKVIFACVHNAGRSQMAAAFFNQYCDPGKALAVSAGTKPGIAVHPKVLMAMKEEGIDLSSASPQLLTDELAADAYMLITMGCGESCPTIHGLKRADWKLQDPRGQSIERVREIRNEVKQLVQNLTDELDVSRMQSRDKTT